MPGRTPFVMPGFLLTVALAVACTSPRDETPQPTPAAAVAGTPTEVLRLERLAARALAEGQARLAYNLSRKANRAGETTLEGAVTAMRASAQVQDQGAAAVWLLTALERGFTDRALLESLPELAPLRADPSYPGFLRRLEANLQQQPLPVGTGLTRTTPEAAGFDPDALARLLKEAEEAETGALILLKDGQLAGEWYFGGGTRRIETMSATKAIVSLAIGLLLQEGLLPSLDTPVAHFFPEWSQRPNRAITVRHLLSHTSGLEANRLALEVYLSRDLERNALEAGLADQPGTRFFYNNKATNLLAALVQRASGEPIDVFLDRRLFAPMEITDYFWQRDPRGARYGMAGLRLHALDFAKLGQLVLDGGRWRGVQLLDPEWLAQSTLTAGQPFDSTSALLWWRIPRSRRFPLNDAFFSALERQRVPASLVRLLEPLRGRSLEGHELEEAFRTRLRPFQHRLLASAMRAEGLDSLTVESKDQAGFAAKGSLGNFLFVMPQERLVAVRMCDAEVNQLDPGEVMFPAFFTRVRALVEADLRVTVDLEGLDGEEP